MRSWDYCLNGPGLNKTELLVDEEECGFVDIVRSTVHSMYSTPYSRRTNGDEKVQFEQTWKERRLGPVWFHGPVRPDPTISPVGSIATPTPRHSCTQPNHAIIHRPFSRPVQSIMHRPPTQFINLRIHPLSTSPHPIPP